MKNAAMYREVANIPLIIKGGDRGKVVSYPASHIDLAPTILDYFGQPVPKLLEGKSMMDQIKDEMCIRDRIMGRSLQIRSTMKGCQLAYEKSII